jgi:DNA invertase Pin-like site-specific DNA recombinase
MSKKYVTYIRVSTQKQGTSGLGLESQRSICGDFIRTNNGECVAEFKDVESGTHRDRKGLQDAILFCKQKDCALVIAKLDRLARDVEFCFKVVNTGIEIHFCDMPSVNTLLLGVFASVAQYERELTSDRTKKALAAKKLRGEKTGGAADKWRETFNNKSKEQFKKECMQKGHMKNERHIAKKETQAFLRILRNLFPDACRDENPVNWNWKGITTAGENKDNLVRMIKDYQSMDDTGTLFRKWKFDEWTDRQTQVRLCAHISNLRVSFKSLKRHQESNNN